MKKEQRQSQEFEIAMESQLTTLRHKCDNLEKENSTLKSKMTNLRVPEITKRRAIEALTPMKGGGSVDSRNITVSALDAIKEKQKTLNRTITEQKQGLAKEIEALKMISIVRGKNKLAHSPKNLETLPEYEMEMKEHSGSYVEQMEAKIHSLLQEIDAQKRNLKGVAEHHKYKAILEEKLKRVEIFSHFCFFFFFLI